MNRRFSALGAVLVVAILTLSACASPEPTPTPKPTNPPPTATAWIVTATPLPTATATPEPLGFVSTNELSAVLMPGMDAEWLVIQSNGANRINIDTQHTCPREMGLEFSEQSGGFGETSVLPISLRIRENSIGGYCLGQYIITFRHEETDRETEVRVNWQVTVLMPPTPTPTATQ